ncbi:hypothetical protein [Rossellomorea sp. NS-SX7]|uniref:hypothetical protein n=1 Tax=Rossellomorea sp. NS-SX7 TaxID=3463856 RepID=UPI0040584839
MNALLFAAGAYLLLLPFLKFIPIQLPFKQKVMISSISFCITILALIGSEFLPFISVFAILVLLTGMSAYLIESRIQNRTTVLHPEPQPESLSPATQRHEPKIYETIKEHHVYDADEEAVSETASEEVFIEEEHQDYIKVMEWEDTQTEGAHEGEGPDVLDHNVMAEVEELPLIDDRLPDPVDDPSSFHGDDEEEEYNRLFSGRDR